MPSAVIISKQAYRRASWKNGLGHTDEIAIHPPGAELKRGDFLWRLSSARIEQASPFSAFPAHDRVLVILKGAGVRLTHTFESDEDAVDVPPFEPYEFPGDVPSRCDLVDGPVTDLSVFIRKAEAEAVVEAIEVGGDFAWTPSGRWNFAYAAQGGFQVVAPFPGGAPALVEGDTLRVELERPLDEPVLLRGTGKLVLVGLQGGG